MKRTALLLALSLCPVLMAQEAPQRGPKMEPEMMQAIIKHFDKDGDGKLNQQEREVAKAVGEKIKARFDKDGDGKLSPEERETAKAAVMKRMQAHGQGGRQGQPRADRKHGRMPEQMKQFILKKFDKDADGQLNQQEREALKAAGEKLKDHFDKDGDGKISPEEHQAAKAAIMQHMKRMHAHAQAREGRRQARPAAPQAAPCQCKQCKCK